MQFLRTITIFDAYKAENEAKIQQQGQMTKRRKTKLKIST